MKHVVFAGTFMEAQEHAEESGLEYGQWIYADRRNKIESIDPREIVTHKVGTWEYNADVVYAWRFYLERCAAYGVN